MQYIKAWLAQTIPEWLKFVIERNMSFGTDQVPKDTSSKRCYPGIVQQAMSKRHVLKTMLSRHCATSSVQKTRPQNDVIQALCSRRCPKDIFSKRCYPGFVVEGTVCACMHQVDTYRCTTKKNLLLSQARKGTFLESAHFFKHTLKKYSLVLPWHGTSEYNSKANLVNTALLRIATQGSYWPNLVNTALLRTATQGSH
jgi:hypothetical protein